MNILVVEDEAVSRMAVAEIAEVVSGHAALEAEDGQAAWERLDRGEPCMLVISDVRMPRLDGLQLLTRLRHDPRFEHLPVMLISSAAERATVENAIRGGAQGFVLKPTTLDSVDRIRNVIDQFRRTVLEDSVDVMQRLSATERRFTGYVDALVTLGHKLAEQVDAGIKAPSDVVYQDLSVMVDVMRLAAVSLGARRLEKVLIRLAICLQDLRTTDRGVLGHALAAVRLNLYWLECFREPPRSGYSF